VNRRNIARLNIDGTVDNSFQNGMAGAGYFYPLYSVAAQNDGKVLVGGDFTRVNGVPVWNVARLWGSAEIPPFVKSITRTTGDLNLIWDAIPNRTYRLQYSDAVSGTKWVDVAGDVFATTGTASKTDATLGGAPQRFYRVLLLP